MAMGQAIQLAREHRYAEAEATLKGVMLPSNPTQKIAFYRLKAAIASGLGHFTAAAENMDNAARLATRVIGICASRQASRVSKTRSQSHVDPAQTLKRLRNRNSATATSRGYPSAPWRKF